MEYPILHLFIGDKNIYAKDRLGESASIRLLPSFQDSIILDSSGKKYYVSKVDRIGWAYFFGYHPLLNGRTAKIRYNFTAIEHLSLEDFKDVVVEKLSMGVNKNFWYNGSDIPRLIEQVNNCDNYRAIVECFV